MGEGQLSCEGPEGEEWSQICKGGANGFFMIVLTLGWWIIAADQNTEQRNDANLHLAMEDVEWVLDRMVTLIKSKGFSTTGTKHLLDDATLDGVAVKKR